MMAVPAATSPPTRLQEEAEEMTTPTSDIPCGPTTSLSGAMTTARRRGNHVLGADSERSKSLDGGGLELSPTNSNNNNNSSNNSNGDVVLTILPPLKQRIRRLTAPRLNRKRRSSLLNMETDSCTWLGVIAFGLVVLSAFAFIVMSVATIAAHGLTERQHDVKFDQANGLFKIRTLTAPSCSTPLAPKDINFTLVTQFSDDRMWMMQYHCDRWGTAAPISVVAFTNASVVNITSHLVYLGCNEKQLTVQTLSADLYPPHEYPVNVLRNKALSAVKTTHVMYVDIDFWESENLQEVLDAETTRYALAEDPKLALVVPAFQLSRQCRQYFDCWEYNIPVMPRTKDDLMELLEKKQAASFDPTNTGGHGSTLYNKWFGQETNELIEIPCVRSNRYEPYLAFRYCSSLPPFQEAFSGYGKNKMTWVMHLRRAGYQFQQISAFLVHYPHLDSISRSEWNQKPQELEPVVDPDGNLYRKSPVEVQSVDWQQYKRGKVDARFVEFRNWLQKAIPNATRVARCFDAQDDDSRLWIDRHHPPVKEEEQTTTTSQ